MGCYLWPLRHSNRRRLGCQNHDWGYDAGLLPTRSGLRSQPRAQTREHLRSAIKTNRRSYRESGSGIVEMDIGPQLSIEVTCIWSAGAGLANPPGR